MTALNPVMRVGDQIAEAVLAHAEKQIPRGLNFTPTSAKTALVGDPCSPARDDENIGLNGTAEAVPLQNHGVGGLFQQGVKPAQDNNTARGSAGGKVTKAEAWRLAVEALRTVAIADPTGAARSGLVPFPTTGRFTVSCVNWTRRRSIFTLNRANSPTQG
jgi:ABC-type dipeptide/oligopeptide/nickel transport system ATPase component